MPRQAQWTSSRSLVRRGLFKIVLCGVEGTRTTTVLLATHACEGGAGSRPQTGLRPVQQWRLLLIQASRLLFEAANVENYCLPTGCPIKLLYGVVGATRRRVLPTHEGIIHILITSSAGGGVTKKRLSPNPSIGAPGLGRTSNTKNFIAHPKQNIPWCYLITLSLHTEAGNPIIGVIGTRCSPIEGAQLAPPA